MLSLFGFGARSLEHSNIDTSPRLLKIVLHTNIDAAIINVS